jgi:OFA family oxalate/formate antiporter-like MFS transporter
VGAGFLIGLIGMGVRYSYGVFLKSIEVDFAMSRGATSGIFSLYMLLCCLIGVVGGWATDRYGPRKVGILMGTFTGLSLLLTSQARAPWQLLITYSLLFSLGTGAVYTVVNTTVSRWFVKRRGLVVGITSSAGGVGAIVIAPFATFLISSLDWRGAFVVMGFISWISMVALSTLLRKDPQDIGCLPDAGESGLLKGVSSRKEDDPGPTDLTLIQACGMHQFWLLGFAWLFISLSLHMIFIHIVPYAVGMGISPMDAAFILSLAGLANTIGRLVLGRLSDVMGRKALGIICLLVQFGVVLALIWVSRLWMLYLFSIAFGFLWGGSGTIVTVLIVDIFGTRSLGAIMGMLSAGWGIGAAIGPAIGGYIFDVSGRYFGAFGVGAVALFAAACFLAFIKRIPIVNSYDELHR